MLLGGVLGFAPLKASVGWVGGWGKQVADGPEDARAGSEFSGVSAASRRSGLGQTMEI